MTLAQLVEFLVSYLQVTLTFSYVLIRETAMPYWRKEFSTGYINPEDGKLDV